MILMQIIYNKENIVTTIITTYKRSDSLERAINSVLKQTYENIELIVVDDNNYDSYRKKVEQIMDKYLEDKRVTYIQHKKNLNGATARNTGLRAAKGKFITFLDDDDEFDLHRFEILIPKLNATNSNVGVISSGFIYAKNGIKYREKIVELPRDITNSLLKTNLDIGSGSNFILKRKVLEVVNDFDVRFSRHQDLEYLVRVSEKFDFIVENTKLLTIELDDEHQNKININQLIETKKLYLSKFDYLIKKTNKNSIINSHWEDIIYQIFLSKKFLEHRDVVSAYIEKNGRIKGLVIVKLYLKSKLKSIINK